MNFSTLLFLSGALILSACDGSSGFVRDGEDGGSSMTDAFRTDVSALKSDVAPSKIDPKPSEALTYAYLEQKLKESGKEKLDLTSSSIMVRSVCQQATYINGRPLSVPPAEYTCQGGGLPTGMIGQIRYVFYASSDPYPPQPNLQPRVWKKMAFTVALGLPVVECGDPSDGDVYRRCVSSLYAITGSDLRLYEILP